MGDDFDVDGDWKKARGFLVTFSAIVLLAWFFSADLSTVSILGFSLKTRDNAEHIWAVIALVNTYFIFRYIQKFPAEKKLPDDATRVEFEKTLIKCCLRVYHRKLFRETEKGLQDENERDRKGQPPYELVSIHPNGTMKYRAEYESQESRPEGTSLEAFRSYSRHTVMVYTAYQFKSETIPIGSSTGQYTALVPNAGVVVYAHIIGWVRGCLLTPWLTDYILPLILGAASVIVSLVSWYAINHAALPA